MIAVTFALPAESSAFVRRLSEFDRRGAIVRGVLAREATSRPSPQSSPPGRGGHRPRGSWESGREAVRAAPGEGDSRTFAWKICVVHTGVGAHECKKRLADFLQSEKPRILISSGFCGGTRDEVAPGDLVIAGNYSDSALAERAGATLPNAKTGKLYSADAVIDPAADRYEIGRDHGAIAIDMETETIARMCVAKKIPMLSVRVVSDSPANPFPAPPEILFDLRTQRTRFSRLLMYLLREPAATLRLVRFSKQIAFARTELARSLCTIIPTL